MCASVFLAAALSLTCLAILWSSFLASMSLADISFSAFSLADCIQSAGVRLAANGPDRMTRCCIEGVWDILCKHLPAFSCAEWRLAAGPDRMTRCCIQRRF
jgi:hypothetical protein